jgi:hypothetical protein
MLFGGKITLISPYEQKESHPNIKFVKLEKVAMSVDIVSVFQKRNMSIYEMLTYNVDSSRDKVDFALSDDNLKKVMTSGEKFDLFMLDTFQNDALLG